MKLICFKRAEQVYPGIAACSPHARLRFKIAGLRSAKKTNPDSIGSRYSTASTLLRTGCCPVFVQSVLGHGIKVEIDTIAKTPGAK